MNSNPVYQEEFPEELIDGTAVVMSPAAVNHAMISGSIYLIFADYLHGKQCIPIGYGARVFLTDDDRFVPDFMVVCDRSKIRPDGVYGAPDLVVEVLSPGTAQNDRRHKKEVYEKCGVREYWIVSPGDRTVEQYLLEDGTLVLHRTYADYPDWMLENMSPEARAAVAKSFRCSLYDDLTISLKDIFSSIL